MAEVGEICTRTIEAGDRGCHEEFFWNLVLDSIEFHLLWRETATPKLHSTRVQYTDYGSVVRQAHLVKMCIRILESTIALPAAYSFLSIASL